MDVDVDVQGLYKRVRCPQPALCPPPATGEGLETDTRRGGVAVHDEELESG